MYQKQVNKPLEKESWQLLNNIFFTSRNDVCLVVIYTTRFSDIFDVSFFSHLTNVEKFYIDTFNAVGVENIVHMKKVKELTIKILNLETIDFLDHLNPDMERIELDSIRERNLDLIHLQRFKKLKNLSIDAQKKNLDVLLELDSIEELTLKSIPTKDVSYLRNLKKMKSFKVILGGIKDFSAIKGMDALQYLELYQIRSLKDINFISELPGLQYLYLANLPGISELPSFKNLKKLRRIYINNLKNVNDFSILKEAQTLEEFLMGNAYNVEPDELRVLCSLPNLKTAAVGFGSSKKDTYFEEMMKEHNITNSCDHFNFNFI